jgi:pilus assembly protein TadC
MFESPFFEILAGMAVVCLTLALTWGKGKTQAASLTDRQFRARSLGNLGVFDEFARIGLGQAAKASVVNARYLRGLKQANWYWAVGEPAMPSRRAPFWNLETLWTEKVMSAVLYAGVSIVVIFIALARLAALNATQSLVASIALGVCMAYVGFTGPDGVLRGAARRRQKQIQLEMGYRLPELRSEVLAGRTLMSAIREMSRRPGGPFVEELRRVAVSLDVLKDEAAALEVMLDRNAGNDMVAEFVSQMRMALMQGNEINRMLNVLTSAAQHRLLTHMQAQGRLNAQHMGRPLSLGSVAILALLIMLPTALAISDVLR